MSIPRGFQLVLEDARRAGWGWVGFSYRGTVERTRREDGHEVTEQHTCVHTVMVLWRVDHAAGRRLGIWAAWTDGKWASGHARHPDDPVTVAIGSRDVRPLLSLDMEWPRWVRPDLNAPRKEGGPPRGDEGTPEHERWAPELEARALAGMERTREYVRSTRRRTEQPG